MKFTSICKKGWTALFPLGKTTIEELGKTTIEEPGLTNAEAAKLLKGVVDGLNQGGPGARNLWDILSSLRGPDSLDHELKLLTTSRIRSVIGLHGYECPYIVRQYPLTAEEQRQAKDLLNVTPFHFSQHINHAYRAVEKLFGYRLPEERKVTEETR